MMKLSDMKAAIKQAKAQYEPLVALEELVNNAAALQRDMAEWERRLKAATTAHAAALKTHQSEVTEVEAAVKRATIALDGVHEATRQAEAEHKAAMARHAAEEDGARETLASVKRTMTGERDRLQKEIDGLKKERQRYREAALAG